MQLLNITNPLLVLIWPHYESQGWAWSCSAYPWRLDIGCRGIKDPATGQPRLSGIPSGVYPRLILYGLRHHVQQTVSPEIEVHRWLVSWMVDQMGFEATTIVGNDMSGFQDQFNRLLNVTIEIEATIEASKSLDPAVNELSGLVLIAPEQRWYRPELKSQRFLPDRIRLSQPFFELLMEHPVIVKTDVIKAIQHSCLGLDLYDWLGYHEQKINREGEELKISWTDLQRQLAYVQDKIELENQGFKLAEIDQINQLTSAFPAINLHIAPEFLRLEPGPPKLNSQLSLFAELERGLCGNRRSNDS